MSRLPGLGPKFGTGTACAAASRLLPAAASSATETATTRTNVRERDMGRLYFLRPRRVTTVAAC